MQKLVLAALACVGAAACTPTTTGTVAGATTGAIVGGPVGAVVGAGLGAAAGSASAGGSNAQLAGPPPGYCYVADRAGNIRIDRSGRPMIARC